jgi:cell division protease FtsH
MPFVLKDMKDLSGWAGKQTRKTWSGFKGEPFDDGSKVRESKLDFKKVIGMQHVKSELQKVVTYFNKKDVFDRMGIQPEKGYLLVGPLDTGRSLAHALAGEVTAELKKQRKKGICGVYEIHASLLLQKELKEIIEEAEKRSPCVLVIDELDWLSKQKSVDPKIWSTLVTTMNGLLKSARKQVFMVATAQDNKSIDAAIKDQGRLGITVHFDTPVQAERLEFFQKELDARCINCADFNLDALAQQTAQCSATQLSCVMKRALANAHAQEESLQQRHIEQSIDQVVYNIVEQESSMSPQEKQIIAAHYAGKAVAHMALKPEVLLSRVTILPVAHNQTKPEIGALIAYNATDKLVKTAQDIEHDCIIELAGLEAQKLLFGNLVSTQLAQQVKQQVFAQAKLLAFEGIEEKALPKAVQAERGAHAWQLVMDYTHQAAELLKAYKPKLVTLATHLVQNNTLHANELAQL